MTNDVLKSPKDLPFEEAMAELESIIRRLETGQSTLENSIHLYERGIALKKRCEGELKEAQMKVEKLTFDQNGTPNGAVPLD